ncbi:MAG: O-antigen ligase family protein, partial [Candidatus Baltobacteraceae bacterium]
VTAILAAIGAAVAGPSIYARFTEASVNGGAGRQDIWHVGWLAFTQNWLVGAGYENFAFAYDKAYINVFQPFYTHWHRAPHNLLLGTAVELGVLGLAFMLLAWFGQFKMLSFIDVADQRFGLRLTLQGCVLAMFTVAMFSDIMSRKYIWLLFMLIALTRNARTEPAHNA